MQQAGSVVAKRCWKTVSASWWKQPHGSVNMHYVVVLNCEGTVAALIQVVKYVRDSTCF